MFYAEVVPNRVSGDKTALTYASNSQLKRGAIVDVPLGKNRSNGVVVKSNLSQPSFKTKEARLINDRLIPEELLKTLEWMSDYYITPLPLILNLLLPKTLTSQGRPRKSGNLKLSHGRLMKTLDLSARQRDVVKLIVESEQRNFILHGDTGSGKTLIYRELIKNCLADGKSVLFLVPEISLLTQAVSDLNDLSEHIFITHSALTEARRKEIWLQILQQDKPSVVVGPRSALFSPLKNLGVVIIDEEHESSYKQDSSPRYESQIVARQLAAQHQAKLILGSATPRITDYYIAKTLGNTIIPMPPHKNNVRAVTIIDQAQKQSFIKNHHLSDQLLKELETSLRANRQSLIYLNRRGTASIALCNNCGWSPLCPDCGTALALHHDLNKLVCHQSGYKQPIPQTCPDCGHSDVVYRGVGTKKIESELNKIFPQAVIKRFDSDNIEGERLLDLYGSAHDGQIDIIIGTQTVAKGLDLPKLDLVGVVSADSELYLPDFSAAERSFQLLYQVVGRSARLGHGRVVIQTYHPDHYAIRFAANRDYQGFYQEEIKIRQLYRYPPHRYLLALICSYVSRDKAIAAATLAKAEINKRHKLEVIGPAPAFYERRGRRYRWIVVVKSTSRSKLLPIAREYRQAGWQIDIDPTNLLY